MKNKTISTIFLTTLLSGFSLTLGACANAPEIEYLRIRNSEDYIYIYEEEGDLPDLVIQFEEYMKLEYNRNVKVIYSTYDTNEKLYNDLKIGKSNYDLIVPSDYMIQKLLSLDLLEPFDFDSKEMEMPNFNEYYSPYVDSVIKSLEPVNGKEVVDYCVPYMWGTLGLVYSPTFYEEKLGLEEEELDEYFSSYDVLYNPLFKNTISIKDSVRDLFAIGVVHIEEHKEEIIDLQTKFEEGVISPEEYRVSITEIFNRNDDTTLSLIEKDLIEMKENSFGFEVDSGKNDMVNGTIGGNIAWSGDAVFAIDEASKKDVDLKYSVPTKDTISNIWYDCFCMPKSDTLNKELAQKFIDFIYNPEIAALNMDYIGYTCAVGGEDILNLMYDYYDVRGVDEETGVRITELDSELVEGEDYVQYDLTYFFEGTIENINDAVLLCDPFDAESGLKAQYPAKEDLDYLAIMKDFGERNKAVMHMWEKVKSSPIPVFLVVIMAIEFLVVGGFLAFFLIYRHQNRKLRTKTSK